jgi:hypothetical protein
MSSLLPWPQSARRSGNTAVPNKRMQLTKLRAAPVRRAEVPPCAPAGWTDGGTASQLIRSVGLTVGWRGEGTPLPHGVRPTEPVPTSSASGDVRGTAGRARAMWILSSDASLFSEARAQSPGGWPCNPTLSRARLRTTVLTEAVGRLALQRGVCSRRTSGRRHLQCGGECERPAPRRTTKSAADVPYGAEAVARFRNGAAGPGKAHGEAAWGSPTSGCS